MPWYPKAVKRPVNRSKRAMRTPRRINLHTAVSNSSSMFTFFSGTSVFSHFYVREDGTVEQYQDTALQAACDLQGNPDTISVESWDGYGATWRTGNPPAWTTAQVSSLVELVAWIFKTHPSIPEKRATSNRRGAESYGLSYHRLGVPGYMKYPTPQGLKYSTARGKVCPGPARISQIPGIFTAATSSIKAPVAPIIEEELSMADIAKIMAEIQEGREEVRYVQAQLKAIAENTYGREALDANTNRTLALVERVSDAQAKTLTATMMALDKGDVSQADLEALTGTIRAEVLAAINQAKQETEDEAAAQLEKVK